eukprot:Rhum_TRINITY_DN8316_c0_g1::Rhum_TRINITY_DN8316_c0_g1_i1::g.27311::m.27311
MAEIEIVVTDQMGEEECICYPADESAQGLYDAVADVFGVDESSFDLLSGPVAEHNVLSREASVQELGLCYNEAVHLQVRRDVAARLSLARDKLVVPDEYGSYSMHHYFTIVFDALEQCGIPARTDFRGPLTDEAVASGLEDVIIAGADGYTAEFAGKAVSTRNFYFLDVVAERSNVLTDSSVAPSLFVQAVFEAAELVSVNEGAAVGWAAVLQHLLAHGMDVDRLDGSSGMTALHHMASGSNVAVARFLLDNGADPNACAPSSSFDSDGNSGGTPLYFAARNRCTSMVQLLLSYGADPNMGTHSGGHTPLLMALRRDGGDHDVETVLIDAGAAVSGGGQNEPPLAVAVRRLRGHDLITHLVARGASVDEPDKDGLTPLLLALQGGLVSTAELLLERGANVAAKDERGYTPLEWACFCCSSEVVHFLLDKGADPTAVTVAGKLPVCWAIERGLVSVAERLIAAGAPVCGNSLLEACSRSPPGLVELLLQRGAPVAYVNMVGGHPLKNVRARAERDVERGAAAQLATRTIEELLLRAGAAEPCLEDDSHCVDALCLLY